jgi:hypothetical protein
VEVKDNGTNKTLNIYLQLVSYNCHTIYAIHSQENKKKNKRKEKKTILFFYFSLFVVLFVTDLFC